MRERFFLIAKTYLLWFVFFAFCRGVFFLFHTDRLSGESWQDRLYPFIIGCRLDIAMGGYFCLFSGVILLFLWPAPNGVTYRVYLYAMWLLGAVNALIITLDIELYRHWSFRINNTSLFYADRAGIKSIPWYRTALLTFLFCLLALGLGYFFKWLAKDIRAFKKSSLAAWSCCLICLPLLVIPIRGGLNKIPINVSAVYFHHESLFLNHLGVNPVWHFFNSLLGEDAAYPNHLDMPDTPSSGKSFSDIIFQGETPDSLCFLRTQRPNIILVVMESFTAKVVAELGGMKGITPHFSKLCKEGILFRHFFASGDRTDKGILALLSAYPAQPLTSIIQFPEKTQSLLFFPKVLQNAGYNTSFYYGGEIGFANVESYLKMAGFERLSHLQDYPASIPRNSSWGVADEFVFDRVLKESPPKEPFFTVILTLSSHEPFLVPMPTQIAGKDEESMFCNALYYASKSLYDFIEKSKKTPWWKNTWVIITADHGHRMPTYGSNDKRDQFAIPMVWLGGALKRQGFAINTIGCQTDVAETVLSQMGLAKEQKFPFSQNMMGNPHPFASYSFNNGFGYESNSGDLLFDFNLKQYLRQKATDSDREIARLYWEQLFRDYNGRGK